MKAVDSDDGENIYSTTEAEIDVENNKATAAIEPPSDSSDEGSTYIVRANFLGSIDTDHVECLRIHKRKRNHALDIRNQLFSTSGSAYGDEIAVDSSNFTKSTSEFSAEIPVPQDDDVYIVKVLTDGKAQGITTKLTVNGPVPKFTKFKIPKAGITAAGETLIKTISKQSSYSSYYNYYYYCALVIRQF